MIAQKWKVRAGILAAATIIFFAGNSIITKADGSSSTVGTIDDPLITKSYFDQQIANAVKQEVAAQLSNSAPGSTTQPTPDSGGTEISVVQLQAGQTLQAGAGSELIVRTGKVLAFSGDENGIPDVTSGKDISAGSAIELNHLLIFPREGRGIKPDPKSKATVFVMIRGDYSIINPDGTKAMP